MANKNNRILKVVENDNNLCFTSMPHGDRRCPYCNEVMTNTQVVFYIAKTKINNQGERVTFGKRLPASCGWNCSRKVIDKLNAERTEDEIKNNIEYRRV